MPIRTQLETRMIRRRLARKTVAPCRTAPTREHPDGKPIPVSTPYRRTGRLWSLGYHTGEDYAAPTGSLAVATSWGEVIATGITTWGPAYGLMVVIRTGSGRYDYAFCHLSEILVNPGDLVRPGTVVGKTGQTGNTTGPHLHFEARPAGGRLGTDVKPSRVRRMAA